MLITTAKQRVLLLESEQEALRNLIQQALDEGWKPDLLANAMKVNLATFVNAKLGHQQLSMKHAFRLRELLKNSPPKSVHSEETHEEKPVQNRTEGGQEATAGNEAGEGEGSPQLVPFRRASSTTNGRAMVANDTKTAPEATEPEQGAVAPARQATVHVQPRRSEAKAPPNHETKLTGQERRERFERLPPKEAREARELAQRLFRTRFEGNSTFMARECKVAQTALAAILGGRSNASRYTYKQLLAIDRARPSEPPHGHRRPRRPSVQRQLPDRTNYANLTAAEVRELRAAIIDAVERNGNNLSRVARAANVPGPTLFNVQKGNSASHHTYDPFMAWYRKTYGNTSATPPAPPPAAPSEPLAVEAPIQVPIEVPVRPPPRLRHASSTQKAADIPLETRLTNLAMRMASRGEATGAELMSKLVLALQSSSIQTVLDTLEPLLPSE